MNDLPPVIVAQEIQVVDAQGQPRIVMSAKAGRASVSMTGKDKASIQLTVDEAGLPSVRLAGDGTTGQPVASLEIDGKGAHVKFDRTGGASSYLFLNNAGGSGVVLIDATGRRRLNITVDAAGTTSIERFDLN